MGSGKPVILALLAGLMLSGQDVAVAQKGALWPQPAAFPSVNLGLSGIPNMRTPVGVPAAAMAAKAGPESTPFGGSGPGHGAGKGDSAQMAAPGSTRSASSAGLTPPGQSNQPNRGASDDNSAEAQEKIASLTGTSTGVASVSETDLSQLPTCR